jgi:hypothetical protein
MLFWISTNESEIEKRPKDMTVEELHNLASEINDVLCDMVNQALNEPKRVAERDTILHCEKQLKL